MTKLKVQSMKEVERELWEASQELKQTLKTRLDVNKVMNQIIWGNSKGGSYFNCPPGYDNEGNITPNQNF